MNYQFFNIIILFPLIYFKQYLACHDALLFYTEPQKQNIEIHVSFHLLLLSLAIYCYHYTYPDRLIIKIQAEANSLMKGTLWLISGIDVHIFL